MDRRMQAVEEVLEARREIALAYLFGSTARGTAVPNASDIDVAVSVVPPAADPLSYRVRLMEELARAAAGVSFDVLILEEAPPALAGRVIREGKLLVCRDEPYRVRRETEILLKEFDTEPLRLILDRAQSDAIRSGRFYG